MCPFKVNYVNTFLSNDLYRNIKNIYEHFTIHCLLCG